MSDLRNELDSLCVEEKVDLLDAVWQSLKSDASSLTDAQRAELDRRTTHHEQDPSDLLKNLIEAHAWYQCISPEVGDRFTRAVEAAIDAIVQRPLQFPIAHRGRRRAGVRRFPGGIFFELQAERIVVIACFHSKRNPKRWQAR